MGSMQLSVGKTSEVNVVTTADGTVLTKPALFPAFVRTGERNDWGGRSMIVAG